MKKLILVLALSGLTSHSLAADSKDVLTGVIGGIIAGGTIVGTACNGKKNQVKNSLAETKAQLKQCKTNLTSIRKKLKTNNNQNDKSYFYTQNICTDAKELCIGDFGTSKRGNTVKVVGMYKDGDVGVIDWKSKNGRVYKRSIRNIKRTSRNSDLEITDLSIDTTGALTNCADKIRAHVLAAAKIEKGIGSTASLSVPLNSPEQEGENYVYTTSVEKENSVPPQRFGTYRVTIKQTGSQRCSITKLEVL